MLQRDAGSAMHQPELCGPCSDANGRSLIHPLTVEVVALLRFSALCHKET